MSTVSAEQAKESLETVSKFYLAVTDYFRDGHPSRLLQRIHDLGMPAERALETLRAFLKTTEGESPVRKPKDGGN